VLVDVARLPQLQTLHLQNAQVTDAGVQEMLKALPKARRFR
jgi:hypothetical protein